MNPQIKKFLIRIFVLSVLAVHSACITEEKQREKIRWRLDQFPVNTTWPEPDRKNPIMIIGLPDSPPEKYILSPLPQVGNQGFQASGSAWAAAAASSYMFHVKRNVHGYFCSPSFLYNILNSDRDGGIELYQALHLFQSTGCPREQLMPYNPADYVAQPSPDILKNAMNYRIAGYSRVDFSDINQIKGHLLQNSIVMITINMFENLLTLKQAEWEGPVGARMGRHSVSIIGYDDARKAFLIQNSAGTEWGSEGTAWIPYDWMIRIGVSAYVLW